MDEEGGEVPDNVLVDLRITDLADRRMELALNCRFRSCCIARSRNCHTCPRREGVQYTLRDSQGTPQESWEVFDYGPATIPEFLQNPVRRG